ncbi:alpha/beta-hydrolase [Roridomyces roridus]|uniref:Alpha/beta-hydrolase n=1 Tax=Roridomyces roridus TaxID=1738132 RepID=A0AAD7FPN8_9AGAR|nr:alpha/beta-hydrolase [Roridomyces roridus]
MTTTEEVNEPIPLVVVQGFLSSAGAYFWGDFGDYLNKDGPRRRTIFVSVGPVSSLHDRACELYYALMGGTADYGAEHSKIHNHARYGRHVEHGQYPEWSPNRPLHFLGHSMGGPTIIKLQSLIKQGHFGSEVHPRMILSVNTISAPFRGTQAVYLLGERVDGAPAVRPLSVGAFVGRTAHILSFLSPFLPPALDMHADCRSLTYRDASLLSLLKQLWRSDWAESRDVTPFDTTFQAADERESDGEGYTEPETFYRSHVAVMTRRNSLGNFHSPSMYRITSPFMYFFARRLGNFDFSTLRPRPSFLDHDSKSLGEEFWANDGVVPVFSQWHPHPCSRTRCQHEGKKANDVLEPGIWYVKSPEEDTHHLSIVPRWTATDLQRRFWVDLGQWLTSVEGTRRKSNTV